MIGSKLRVCIVTAEIHGLFKNGGIGTANSGLARELAAAGHEVTVGYVDPGSWTTLPTSEAFGKARERWRDDGVLLETIPRCSRLKANVEDVGWSYSTFDYLRTRRFDVVMFNECGGQAYYAALAKRAGVFPHAPRLVVVAHGPSDWARELNTQLPGGYRAAALSFLERRSVELADLLVSPSRYLLGWFRERGWRLPAHVETVQNIVPSDLIEAGAEPQRIDELVFFGRLESRKGLEIFCDTVEALEAEGRLRDASVAFLGKFSRVGPVHSGVWLLERTKGWRVAPRFLANLDQSAAMEYLRRPGALAVMPSLAENSPCVVVECLLAGVPFLASSAGGAPELVAETDRARCLAAPNAPEFAARLSDILSDGQGLGHMATPQADTRARWRKIVAQVETVPERRKPRPASVSLCFSLPVGAEIDAGALETARAQIDADPEIVVAHYGAQEDRGPQQEGRIVRVWRREGGRAAARNAAAAAATGQWLMFPPEAGWRLEPGALATLAGAAESLAAEAICAMVYVHTRPGAPMRSWDGEIAALPLGPAAEIAAFENCLGDEVFLISARAFAGLGGFDSSAGVEIENRLLLTRALMQGVKVELAPEQLGWVRAPREGHAVSVSDMRRVLALYAARPVGEFGHVFESVLNTGRHQLSARAQAWLAPIDEGARELAHKLTFEFPNGEDASFPTFLKYVLARERYAEALDFARLHDPQVLLPVAEAAARRADEHSLAKRTRNAPSKRAATVSLTKDMARTVRLVSAPPDVHLVNDGHCVGALRLAPGLAVAKAPLALPSGVERADAWLDFAGAPQSEFALVAAEPHARFELEALESGADEGASFSGWTRGDHVALENLPAGGGEFDLFLMARTPAHADGDAWAAWRRVEARVEISRDTTPSGLLPKETRHPLPLHVLHRAQLQTEASDFAYPVFTPGEFTQHHPLPGRPAVVRIPQALPAGALGVAAAFSTQNERAHPIAFALWLRASDAPAQDEAGLADSAASSGWTLCAKPFEIGVSEVRLPAAAQAPMDLYLATKVVGFDDIYWCHAFWREIAVIEALRR